MVTGLRGAAYVSGIDAHRLMMMMIVGCLVVALKGLVIVAMCLLVVGFAGGATAVATVGRSGAVIVISVPEAKA